MTKALRQLCTAILVALFLVSGAVQAVSAEQPTSRTVRVGCVDIDNFLVVNQDGSLSGYGAEYLNEIGKQTGWQYEYVYGTWNECMDWLRSGKIDLLFPAERTEERERDFAFSTSECCIDYAALLTGSDNETLYYGDFASFNGITVGLIAGNYLNEVFADYCEKNDFTCRLQTYSTGTQLSEALQSGAVDAIVTGNLNIGSGQKILAKFDYMPAYFMTRRGDTQLLTELNEALYRINLENPYFTAQLVEQYYGQSAALAKGFTREETEFAKACATLRVVCSGNNYPFEWLDTETGEYRGTDVDLLKLIAQKAGLSLEFLHTSSQQEAQERLTDGTADLMIGFYGDKATQQQSQLRFSDYYNTQACALVGYATFVDERNALTLVIPASFAGSEQVLATQFPQWTIHVGTTPEDCLHQVAEKKADLLLADAMQLQPTGLLDFSDSLTVVSNISCRLQKTIAISPSQPEILDSLLNKSISLLTKNERDQALLENRAASSASFSLKSFIRQQPFWFAVILVIICLFLTVILLLVLRGHSRTKQNRILEEKNKQLRRASNAKTEFLSRMSHDMRTPMNGILGLIELSREEPMTPQLREYLDQEEEAGRFLLGLINDTLDMNRIESQKLELRREAVQMERFLTVVADMIRPTAEKKQVSFRLQKSGNLQEVWLMDRLRMQQALTNILSNAIKFTPSGGSVTFSASSQESETGTGTARWRFEITDTGIGISEEFLPKIFLPFEQEQANQNAVAEGTGLGLSIVKKLMELMHGTVEIKSALGKGTTVTVTLDLQKVRVLELEKEGDSFVSEVLQGRQILFCEDNAINTQISVHILENTGCVLTCASNGKEGLDCFRASDEYHFDAVLMDVRMPVMDGLTATRAIRALPRADATDVPILAMTANAFEEDIENCLAAGMNCHLAKPVNSKTLCRVLAQQIQKRGECNPRP